MRRIIAAVAALALPSLAWAQLSPQMGAPTFTNPGQTRLNLGLGTIATQSAAAVAIAGGTIAGTPISGSTGAFSTLSASGTVSGAGITALLAPYAPLASPTFTGTIGGAAMALTGNATIGGTLAVTGATTLASTTIANLSTLQVGTGNNGFNFAPKASGSPPVLATTGPDAVVGLNFNMKGAGLLQVTSGTFGVNAAAYTVSGATLTPGIGTNQSWNGTTTAGLPAFNRFFVSDGIDASNGPSASPRAVDITHNYGGGTTKGGRVGLNVQLVQNNGANTDTGADNFYVGGATYSFARFSQPGATAAAPLGRIFGFNAFGTVQTGFTATNLFQVAGAEINVAISAGSSSFIRDGLAVVDTVGAVQGFGVDNAYWLYRGANDSALWRYGFMFGDVQGWPMDPALGTMIGSKFSNLGYAAKPSQTKWGVDFTQVVFPSTGNPYDGGFLASPGFNVDGVGTLRLGTTYFTSSSAGLGIDAKGSIGASATIATAGTGYSIGTNNVLGTALGGLFGITVNGSGVPTSVTLIVPPVFSSTTPPANPITLVIQNPKETGTGLTINIAWNTAATALSLQASGGPMTIGGTLAVTGGISGAGVTSLLAPYAPLASPSLTGTPLSTTAAVDTNTTQIATTAFVLAQASAATPLINGTATIGTSTRFARADHVHPTDTTRAPTASPVFTTIVNVGTNAAAATLALNGPSGVGRPLQWKTAGLLRAQFNLNATAEGGANAGSDVALTLYDDSGTLLTTPLTITRSSGLMTFATAVKFSGTNIVANGAIATTMTSLGPTGSHATIQEWLTIQNSAGVTRYIPAY